jgi:hypothetical protein
MVELSRDPEGQEYAYRMCDDTGRFEVTPSLDNALERCGRMSRYNVEAWVERALLGTWERVE